MLFNLNINPVLSLAMESIFLICVKFFYVEGEYIYQLTSNNESLLLKNFQEKVHINGGKKKLPFNS